MNMTMSYEDASTSSQFHDAVDASLYGAIKARFARKRASKKMHVKRSVETTIETFYYGSREETRSASKGHYPKLDILKLSRASANCSQLCSHSDEIHMFLLLAQQASMQVAMITAKDKEVYEEDLGQTIDLKPTHGDYL
ncbi:hypothetical protein Tco_1134145 [Tanacetum coccineum]